LRTSQYKTHSDCISSEKNKDVEKAEYQQRLLKSIERKAMKEKYWREENGLNISYQEPIRPTHAEILR
jgi:hypothetical protein